MPRLKRHVKRLKTPSRRLIIAAVVLIGVAALLYALMSRPPGTLWLPNSTAYSSDDDILYLLPVSEQHAATLYGRGLVFTSANQSTTIYEFTASPLLNASKCPDIHGPGSLDPTKCEVQGSFNGSKLYGINRSDGSSLTEQYIQLSSTFIYIVANFNRGTDYIKHFVPVPRGQLASYLSANHGVADPVTARQQQAKATADQESAVAYTKLPFTPVLPKTLPSGWHMLTDITGAPVELYGPDADHPMLVSTDFTTNGKRQDVRYFISKLSASQLGSNCGPSPSYSMQPVACTKVPGTDYYEAELYDDLGDFLRYLYRPVGDALVITDVTVYDKGSGKPMIPDALTTTQNTITENAQPVNNLALKGSVYELGVFY